MNCLQNGKPAPQPECWCAVCAATAAVKPITDALKPGTPISSVKEIKIDLRTAPRAHFVWLVHVDFFLAYDDLMHVIGQAMGHYDRTCVQAAMPGGFLYGWRMAFELLEEGAGLPGDVHRRMSTDEVDLVCKILEQPNLPPFPQHRHEMIVHTFRAALKLMNERPVLP